MENHIGKGAREFARFPFLLELIIPRAIQPLHVRLKGAMVLDSIAIDIIGPGSHLKALDTINPTTRSPGPRARPIITGQDL